jgi:DNA repair exonuclease SbcCD ATPase subunit
MEDGMTNDLEDFAHWRRTMEVRVGTLETKVGEHAFATRREEELRAAMDEDMSKLQTEFRVQRSLLQALHDTQSDHTRRLTSIEGRLVGVEGRLENVEGRLGGVEGTLHKVHTGVETIREMLDRTLNSGS